MIKDGIGGASTRVGLDFEERVNLLLVFAKTPRYSVQGDSIFYDGEKVAQSIGKNKLYRFLEKRGVDYKTVLSKKLLPDEALYVQNQRKVFIIEMKFQEVAGSVDEKLQTCDFKKRQYQKLFKLLKIDVEFIYILSDWFKKPEYKDTLSFISDVGCNYYFHMLPLKVLGLPIPKK
ncbi:MAG: hypothetical protein HY435_01580 [Candidatus Liptonbacteria bacterium]|nr:hypothetical protein [Candidatus Liptonbacteria bacterium]